MKRGYKFAKTMIEALKEKFPEDYEKLCEFEKVMWIESAELQEDELQSMDNFIEYIGDKLLNYW